MKVLNFGSLNLDYVYSVPHIVVPGETLASFDMSAFCGGKGLNQSIALAKAGAKVYHAGMVGEEGDLLLDTCINNGVNTDYIKKISGKSGHTIIQVDENGQNCILLYGGANRKITEEFVDEVLGHFEEGDILILQNELNLIDYIVNAAYERKMSIILNPSPFDDGLKNCDFNKLSMILINEIEGSQITGESETDKILETLQSSYPNLEIVLTLGSEGAVYQYGREQHFQKSCKVNAVDTTAAGDTFTGYFIASMIEGASITGALELASRAAAIAVSKEGAAASIPVLDEVRKWNLDNNRK